MMKSPLSVVFSAVVILALAADGYALGGTSQSLQALLADIQISTRTSSSAPTDRAALKSAVLAGNFTPLPDYSRHSCPVSCKNAGINPSAWFVYSSVSRLEACKEAMLLDFALSNQLDDPRTHSKISACTADLDLENDKSVSLNDTQNAACQPNVSNLIQVTSTLQSGSMGSSSASPVPDVVAGLQQLQTFLRLSDAGCNETIIFAYSGTSALGLYVGSGLSNQGSIASVLDQLSTEIQSAGTVSEDFLVQLCDDRSARYSFGVVINTRSDLGSAQVDVQSLKNGTCLTKFDMKPWQELTYSAPPLLHNSTSNSTNSTTVTIRSESSRKLSARTNCNTIKVASGDTCGSLAAECGITPALFTTYNPSATECSTLAVGELVCCSAGTLPNNTPVPSSNGYCYSYLVRSGDSCSALAATYDITVADIMSYNTNTWGWNGCADLFAGNYICLSTGYNPMPANIPNAVCGPQVNDTAVAPPGTDLSTLNECPLNACCDIWGQCGTTSEFCTISNSTTGAPGTAAAGQNGCISNCGTQITTSTPPAQYFSVAYFEAWDWERPCLRMGVEDVSTSTYTHIHFAFATINPDWSLNISAVASQFEPFVAIKGIKRILSIGGWAFSTDPDTYMIFRNVVNSEGSREALISNVVNFLNLYDLDGVDWDWEYPNEPDIPGIPAGSPADSIGFFLLIDELRNFMNLNAPGKTISITAPASYWYLKEFPILALSSVVDYIVYMTYDLHGQWDYGRVFSDPGCPEGGCLRSHVNISETINALSMITKAGVASNMILAGVSSYGRSFEITTVGCTTEECTFTGPLSGALPGPCTDTAGYIANYELETIISDNPSAVSLWDAVSYSNILVYNSNQWVGYMNDSNKAVRNLLYKGLTFLGISDWAVDLQSEDGDGGLSGSDSSSGDTVYIDPGIWSSATPLVTASPGMTLIWPPLPLSTPTTISFPLWTTTVSYSSLTTLTSTLSGGVTSTYPWYIYVSMLTTITIPDIVTDAIPVWGVTLSNNVTGGAIYLTSSVQPPVLGVTVTPVISGTTSIIGATETSTVPGAIVTWGGNTYSNPPETETEGGSTTIIGGITLAPVVISVTPNPHPTTIPSTLDPVLNSRSATWISGTPGSTPKPTNKPGCMGCGLPCGPWCDSACPFCPPWETGSGDDGSDGDDDDNSSSESQSSTESASHTVLYEEDIGDSFDGSFAALTDLLSLMSEDQSLMWSMFGIMSLPPTTTSPINTPTSVPPTSTTLPPTTTTPIVAPTPSCACSFWDEDLISFEFEIYNITGWSTDGGAALEKQEKGCGALTYWEWVPATSTTFAYVHFHLPDILKSGCVERAIQSAGGPKIKCAKGGVIGGLKRDGGTGTELEERDITGTVAQYLPPTSDQLEIMKAVYANSTGTGVYIPMDWGSGQ